MLPSADPVTKYSSVGSIAMALTGESWLWKSCLCCRCLEGQIHMYNLFCHLILVADVLEHMPKQWLHYHDMQKAGKLNKKIKTI